MKVLKTILGVLLTIGLLGSIFSFFTTTLNETTPDILGHLLAIIIIAFVVYLCFKPSKAKNKNLPKQ